MGLRVLISEVRVPHGCRHIHTDGFHVWLRYLESSLDVAQNTLEDGLPVAVHRVSVRPPSPVRVQVPEEAALRVRLHPEDVPFPIAEPRDVERRPARVPRIAGILPPVVHEPEDDLIVVDQFLQDPLLPVGGEEELALGMRGNERDDLTFFQGPGEGAGPAVLQTEEARPALVMAWGVRREDRLRGVGPHPPAGREEAPLDQEPEALAPAANMPDGP